MNTNQGAYASAQLFFKQNPKAYIAPMLWPRVLVIKIRRVAVALTPIIHSSNQAITNGLHYLNIGLTAIGWALHGIRLLINIMQLVTHFFAAKREDALRQESQPTPPLKTQFDRTYVELGDDTLWMLSALMPTDNLFCASFVMALDILWLGYCLTVELNRLNKAVIACEANQTESAQELAHLRNLLAHTQKRAVLNAITTLSTTLLFIAKHFILPCVLPTMALHPATILVFTLLSLSITIARHVAGKWLAGQKIIETREDAAQPEILPKQKGAVFFNIGRIN